MIIPCLVEEADGTLDFTDQILYPRGSGLSYQEEADQPDIPSKAKSPAVKASPLLLAKMVSKGNNKLSLTWNRVGEADGYDIYLSQCGKSLKKIKTLKGSAFKTCTKGGLRKRTAYKGCVKAYPAFFPLSLTEHPHPLLKSGIFFSGTRNFLL